MSKAAKRMIYQTVETREKILQAAEAMFIEKGFFDTQMKDVALAVDISRNSLYRYFADKMDLGFAVMHKVGPRLETPVNHCIESATGNPDLSALEQLQLVAHTMITADHLNDVFCFMAEFDAYFSGNRIPADFHSRFAEALPSAPQLKLLDIIAAGAIDGSIRQDYSPEEVSDLLIYSLKVLQQHLLMRRTALLTAAANSDRLLPNLLSVLIDGLKPVTSVETKAKSKIGDQPR